MSSSPKFIIILFFSIKLITYKGIPEEIPDSNKSVSS